MSVIKFKCLFLKANLISAFLGFGFLSGVVLGLGGFGCKEKPSQIHQAMNTLDKSVQSSTNQEKATTGSSSAKAMLSVGTDVHTWCTYRTYWISVLGPTKETHQA